MYVSRKVLYVRQFRMFTLIIDDINGIETIWLFFLQNFYFKGV